MHLRQDITTTNTPTRRDYTWGIGVFLITVGFILLINQYFRINWLSLTILPITGIILMAWGIISRKLGLIIPGSILFSLGAGSFFAFSFIFQYGLLFRIGILLVIFSVGWGMITLFSYMYSEKIYWWALVPGSILAGLGVCLILPFQLVNFALYPIAALGLAFLAWGFSERLIGLVIPASILLGIGPGIYFAWHSPAVGGSLTQTGIMLVCFAVGWGLITIFSRLLVDRFIWWPLIPGAILAMTGIGLYIGGNPEHAMSFIGNTTSVGLILFGLYLVLWHSGFKK